MGTEIFIARRYMLSRKHLNFITIISYLSFGGITLGVAALITVLSVFNGFSSLVTSYLISLDPYIRVEAISRSGLDSIPYKEEALFGSEPSLFYTRYVESRVLLFTNHTSKVVSLKGVDAIRGDSVLKLRSYIIEGRYDLSSDGKYSNVILGSALANYLGIIPGDTLTIVSPFTVENTILLGELPAAQKVIAAGIFQSQHNEYDAAYMFMDISPARAVLGYGNSFQGYEIRFADIAQSDAIKARLRARLSQKDFQINTWFDLHKELLLVMNIERWAAYLLLMLIIIVAVFNILASLAMSVIEKKRDIGILQAMGMRPASIKKIFLVLGTYTGILGTFLGFMLGLFIFYLQKTYNIYPLDPMTFKIDALPMELRLLDFFFVGAASVGLSILAALIPARRAANVNALEAIRWE